MTPVFSCNDKCHDHYEKVTTANRYSRTGGAHVFNKKIIACNADQYCANSDE